MTDTEQEIFMAVTEQLRIDAEAFAALAAECKEHIEVIKVTLEGVKQILDEPKKGSK